jgi:CheY-like chemotaxis protein
VLLLDWKMPDLDGLAVARAVNQALRGQQGPILILATAHAHDELLALPDSQLVDAVLSKPVTPGALYETVAAALEKRAGHAVPDAVPSSRRLDGIRLLVVDDSEVNLEIALLIFENEGARVATAHNGQEALDWLQAHPQQIDLVLMDVQMPVMDGVQATGQIRAIPALAQLPVVALTAGAFKANQEQALAAGMNAYLTKPMDVEQAVAVILRLTGRPEWTGARVSAAHPGPHAQQDLPGLYVTRGLDIWRDASVYQQYLRKFVRDYGDFASAVQPLSLVARQAMVHKLRGAAGNLALDQVAEAAAALDDQLKSGVDADCGSTLHTLQEALQVACTSIAQYADTDSSSQAAPPPVANQALLTRLLQDALSALGQDTPEGVEPLLLQLAALLTPTQMVALQQAVESFDFRAGEAAVQALAASLQLTLKASA